MWMAVLGGPLLLGTDLGILKALVGTEVSALAAPLGSWCQVLLRLPLRNHVTTHAYLWGDSPGTQSGPMALVLHTVALVMSGRPHRPPAMKGPWDECGGPVSTEHALQDRQCLRFPHLGLAIQWPKVSDSFTFPPSPFGAFTQEATERRGAWGCCTGVHLHPMAMSPWKSR